MIVSSCGGRLRVKAKRLKNKSISNKIKTKVEELEGVNGVRVNPSAASLIVNFDQSLVDVESLEDSVFAICSPPINGKNGSKSRISKRINQASKVGMMATLSASLIYGAMGKKKPHIYYGSAFVGLAGLHMLKHSKSLLR